MQTIYNTNSKFYKYQIRRMEKRPVYMYAIESNVVQTKWKNTYFIFSFRIFMNDAEKQMARTLQYKYIQALNR